jgi:hypothetical protein
MVNEYLKTSPIAESITLEGNVILNRLKLSQKELANIQEAGEFKSDFNSNKLFELEVNGLVVALGKIVKKRGEYHFKVTELNKEKR